MIKKAILLIFLLLASSNFAFAHDPNSNNAFWTPGEPLVPCGAILSGGGQCISGVCKGGSNDGASCQDNSQCGSQAPCTKCELWHLLKHLIDFILLAAAPILATFFFVIAGVYMMLGGDNPGMLSTGKNLFKNTLIGLFIVSLAWLITNTLIQSFKDPSAGIGGNWYEYSCTNTGNVGVPPGQPPNQQTVIVSQERVTFITSRAATITWTTNIPATSQVEYGTTNSLGFQSSLNTNRTTSHSVNLTGLTEGTVYFFRVVSAYNFYVARGGIMQFTTHSTSCNPPCPSGQACYLNTQGQAVCVVIPPTNYSCDPMTNTGCPAGQNCYLNPQNGATYCQ